MPISKIRLDTGMLLLLSCGTLAMTTHTACDLSGRKSANLQTEQQASSSKPQFSSYRTDGRQGFEGIYLRVRPSPTKSADVLFRSIGVVEQKLAAACLAACKTDAQRSLFNTLQWSVQPFGPSMADFILVPEKDLDVGADDPVIQSGIQLLKSMSKSLQIDVNDQQQLVVEAVDTKRAQKLFDDIIDDETLFPKSQVAGRTIDTRDSEWALALTNTLAAQKKFFLDLKQPKRPGAGATVAVIDTGITSHPELESIQIVGKQSFNPISDSDELLRALDETTNFAPIASLEQRLQELVTVENTLRLWGPLMNPNHGTSSVSLVASPPSSSENPAADPLGFSVTGTAYGAQILAAKISNSVVLTSGEGAARAIEWSADNGADVISMSVGGLPTPRLFSAVESATRAGVIIVAAAGTGTGSVTVYPASYKSVVGVTSVDQSCAADDQTAYSPLVDVAGPGKNAWFAWTLKHPKREGNTYLVRRAFGTSLSTPHVAGIAALWVAHHGRESLRKKYGRENMVWLFKYLLQARIEGQPRAVHDCDGRFADNGGKNLGSGVIDAMGLLSIDLSTISRETIERYKAGQIEGLTPPGGSLQVQASANLQRSLLTPLRLLWAKNPAATATPERD